MARKITADDLWTMKTLGNVALSPDGRRLAFAMQSTNKAANENRSSISLLSLDEQGRAIGEPRQLTSGLKLDTNPVWASDSRHLLFLSNRDGAKNQLCLIDSDGGEARKLTNMLHGVSDAQWSPDGNWIAFTAPAAVSDEDDVLTGRKSLDESARKVYEEETRNHLRTVTSIWYRVDGRGLFDKPQHLFIMPAPAASGTEIDPATIRRLTTGDVDHTQPRWTPDSREIGVLCNRDENRSRSFVLDLWTINRETGEARRLTENTVDAIGYSWSPDGRAAVVVGSPDLTVHGASNAHLYLVPRHGDAKEKMSLLTSDLDNPAGIDTGGQFGLPGPYTPQWSQDGQHLYFLVTERGCIHVYRMDVAQKAFTRLTEGESITYFLAMLPDDRGLILAQEQAHHPGELCYLSITGTSEPERLTHFYDHMLETFLWGKTERISYRGANNDEIDGWLIHPVGAREGVRYPLLVQIHGGPNWSYGVGRSFFHHYYATQGYAIFYCNPHGSTGYGSAFMRQVLGDWGGQDFQDIMLGVDECIARGVADPERLVVSGYSYGGYMSMFTIGRTDRFKAAVPMAGVSNLSSFVGTSDIGFWLVTQALGYPWDSERADYYRDRSPLTSAPYVKTPTLFIHPENDLRCPIEQSEQFFMALKMMGNVPVEFVRVPEAWHGGSSKPSILFARIGKMLEWFGKYIVIREEEYG